MVEGWPLGIFSSPSPRSVSAGWPLADSHSPEPHGVEATGYPLPAMPLGGWLVSVFIFETGSPCVVLTMYMKLALNAQESAYLCLSSAGITDVCHPSTYFLKAFVGS